MWNAKVGLGVVKMVSKNESFFVTVALTYGGIIHTLKCGKISNNKERKTSSSSKKPKRGLDCRDEEAEKSERKSLNRRPQSCNGVHDQIIHEWTFARRCVSWNETRLETW